MILDAGKCISDRTFYTVVGTPAIGRGFLAGALLLSGCSAFRAEIGLGVGIGAEIELPAVLHTGFSAAGFYYVGHNYKTGWRAGTPSGHFDESKSFIIGHDTDDYESWPGAIRQHYCDAIVPIWTSGEHDPTEWQALEIRAHALFIGFRIGFNAWNLFPGKEAGPPKVEPQPAPSPPPPRGREPASPTAPGNFTEAERFQRGYELLQKGQFQSAAQDFTALVASRPTATAYFNLGLARAALGHHLKAVECFTEALRLKPDLQKAYSARGASNLMSRQLDNAIKDFDKAIELDPKSYANYLGRGVTYQTSEKPNLDLAIADFTKVLEMEPGQGEALLRRLDAYIRKNDAARSKADYEKARTLGVPIPEHIQLWVTAMGLTPAESPAKPESEEERLKRFFEPWGEGETELEDLEE